MFNTLASYLFGSKSNSDPSEDNTKREDLATSQASTSAILQEVDESLINLTTVCSNDEEDEDHDWLLVEKASKSDDEKEDSIGSLSRTDSEGEIPSYDFGRNLFHVTKNIKSKDDEIQNFHRVVQSNLPAFYPNSMEESWFVTPPSCFTSQGPICLETSPFENLLIEHPSMSVYCSLRGSSLNDAVTNSVLDDCVVLEVNQPNLRSIRSRVLRNTDINDINFRLMHIMNPRYRRNVRHHRPTAQAPATQPAVGKAMVRYEEQKASALVSIRDSQKIEEKHKNRPTLTKNAMDRNNLNQKVNGRNGKPRRNDLQHAKLSSRANNNRKC